MESQLAVSDWDQAERIGEALDGELPRPGWDGERFSTPNPALSEQRARSFFRWMLTRRPPRWPRVDVKPARPAAERVSGGDLVVQWVGHSTLLIQTAGMNFLTDPIWSRRCSPVPFAGPKRFADPGIPLDWLPPIDAVLLSHDHYDHFDRQTLRRLHERFEPLFCVPTGVAARLDRLDGVRVAERSWWERVELGSCRFCAVPAQHHSGRGPGDRFRTLWCGWVVEPPDGGAIYFAGDTGWWREGLGAIGRVFPDIRLAALPIGAYSPRWFMSPVHLDPAGAVDVFELVGAGRAVAIHHSTFQLSDEPMAEPSERLAAELAARGIEADRFRALRHGEIWRID